MPSPPIIHRSPSLHSVRYEPLHVVTKHENYFWAHVLILWHSKRYVRSGYQTRCRVVTTTFLRQEGKGCTISKFVRPPAGPALSTARIACHQMPTGAYLLSAAPSSPLLSTVSSLCVLTGTHIGSRRKEHRTSGWALPPSTRVGRRRPRRRRLVNHQRPGDASRV